MILFQKLYTDLCKKFFKGFLKNCLGYLTLVRKRCSQNPCARRVPGLRCCASFWHSGPGSVAQGCEGDPLKEVSLKDLSQEPHPREASLPAALLSLDSPRFRPASMRQGPLLWSGLPVEAFGFRRESEVGFGL